MIIIVSGVPFLGGAEYQLLDLISGLRHKYQIKLICPQTSPLRNELEKDNVEIETLELGSTLGKFRGLNFLDPKNILRIKSLKKIISSFESNIAKNLLITNDYKELILANLAKENEKHIHFQHPELPKWLRNNPLIKKFVVEAMNKADKVVVDCLATKKHLQEIGVKDDKIRVIYNGVDEEMFIPPTTKEKNEARKNLGLGKKVIVGINARVNSGKGYETLIEAFNRLTKRVANAHLVSLGGGNKFIQKKVDRQISQLKLDDKVSFLGNWDRSKVPDFYKALDVFTLPSETEGLPLTVIEAMLSGLPVVATNVGGIPEEVSDGRSGYLIPPKEPLLLYKSTLEILKNKQLAEKMGVEGRKVALQKFTKDKKIARELELINELETR